MVSDQDGGLLSRMKERRIFLFEQIVIFSEPLDKKKGFSMPGYLFKNSIKVCRQNHCCRKHCAQDTAQQPKAFISFFFFYLSLTTLQVSWLGLEESPDNDPCKFILTSRSSTGSTEHYVLHSSNRMVCQAWIQQISSILENQRNFLNGSTNLEFPTKLQNIRLLVKYLLTKRLLVLSPQTNLKLRLVQWDCSCNMCYITICCFRSGVSKPAPSVPMSCRFQLQPAPKHLSGSFLLS